MTRSEKKCYVVSAGFHGLLLIVILFGAALMPKPEEDLSAYKPINVYSAGTISDLMSQGGDAGAAATAARPEQAPVRAVNPPPAPVPEKPTPKPEPVRTEPVKLKPEVAPPAKPEVRHEPVKPKLALERVEPRNSKPKLVPPEEEHPVATKPPKFKIDLKDLKKVDRNDTEKQSQADALAASAARAAQDKARARREREIASTLKSLKGGLSSSTQVQTVPGVGGEGEVSVNYKELVYNKFNNAWLLPATLDSDTPEVTAKIVIARSGQIISATIIRSSGNRIMDRSVENVLANVTFIEPFPDSSRDQERTFIFTFNVQAKRQTG